LSSDQAALCEGHLTPGECLAALQGMARCKAPDLYGLPMEFTLSSGISLVLILFLSSICVLILAVYLFLKVRELFLCLLRRVITLLNIDYKLAARVIAGCLLKVIYLVVDKDQTCGVPGRFIGENVALLRDVVEFASSSGTPNAILSLDQEKAFDCVDWAFMHSTLSSMGFGPSFLSSYYCRTVE